MNALCVGASPFVESLVLILVASICVVVVAAPFAIALSARVGAIDYPDERRIHSEPTARWGGLAVSLGVAAALIITSINYMPNLRALLLGSYMVMLVGLLDDIKRVSVSVV